MAFKREIRLYESPGVFDKDEEVGFTFPNERNRKLYFSKAILGRCSPVFLTMFEHDFKEREDKNVNIVDIKLDDFNKNVTRAVEIAEKYQHESMIKQCRRIMSDSDDVLKKVFQVHKGKSLDVCSSSIIAVLSVAAKYDYEELLKEGADYLAFFDVRNLLKKEHFEKLPVELKYRILSKRVLDVYEETRFEKCPDVQKKYKTPLLKPITM
ncbi:BAT38-like protein [Mya arenaria]|uniref:BAT38-like protein n=1 Tax=Mya arenaria TaxID=6604 RepID=A0ABY7FVT0_MYAAR|nr:BAT38-like protein [Mya arenaria]